MLIEPYKRALKVGDITIRIVDGHVYLEKEDGGVMQVTPTEVDEITNKLQEYYDRKF